MGTGSAPKSQTASVTLSIVSHGQVDLVNKLFEDLAANCPLRLAVILTHNIPEPAPVVPRQWAHHLDVIHNERRAGFGANHNAALRRSVSPVFCVVNPDIRLAADPFPALLSSLERECVAVVGPQVRNPSGHLEDSARRFPTLWRLLRKALAGTPGPDYPVDRGVIEVDWVAGMFMAIRRDAFTAVNGFDERFFLYYEDVDICRRLHSKGFSVVLNPGAIVIHDARRASRRNPRMMRIHAASALRYLLRKYP
ncbi:MAG: glycosyltransferase [Burkholderiales bacterium]